MAIAVTIQRAFHAIFFLVATSAVADQHQCSDSILVIHEHRFDALGSVCDGAEAARVFLRAAGFAVAEPIAIEIVDRLPVEVDRHAVACYVDPEHRVYLLPPSKIAGLGSSGIDPVDQFPYRSRVAHEVAHAIAAMNFRVSRPTIQAHEYIAYVTMLATMEAAQRERVLTQFPGDGYETEQQMNTTIYLCDPMRFGAQAYRHFLKEGNGTDFIRAILAGEVLAE